MDAADNYRLRQRQDTRTSRTWWGHNLHRVRLHRPRALSLVDTLGQPYVDSSTRAVGRRRIAYGTAVVVLALLVLPRVAIKPAPVTIPPDLSSPGVATVVTPVAPPTAKVVAPSVTATLHVVPSQNPVVATNAALSVPEPPPVDDPVGPQAAAPSAPAAPSVVKPVAIRIPAIQVSSRDVTSVGLTVARQLAVPPLSKVGELGWYKYSAVPGDSGPGPSIVVAHVDQKGQLGLFAKLIQLQEGDQVELDRSDGQTAVFQVTQRESFPKASLPSSIYYNDSPDPGLRLITCGGTFNKATHSYVDQEIVFASLVSLRPTVSETANAVGQH